MLAEISYALPELVYNLNYVCGSRPPLLNITGAYLLGLLLRYGKIFNWLGMKIIVKSGTFSKNFNALRI